MALSLHDHISSGQTWTFVFTNEAGNVHGRRIYVAPDEDPYGPDAAASILASARSFLRGLP